RPQPDDVLPRTAASVAIPCEQLDLAVRGQRGTALLIEAELQQALAQLVRVGAGAVARVGLDQGGDDVAVQKQVFRPTGSGVVLAEPFLVDRVEVAEKD